MPLEAGSLCQRRDTENFCFWVCSVLARFVLLLLKIGDTRGFQPVAHMSVTGSRKAAG